MPNWSHSLELSQIRQPKPGTFGRDRPPVGRALGNANKVTKDLKLAILSAAAAHGADGAGAGGLAGYCLYLANSHPKAFSSLLGKMLPFQIDGHLASTVAQINVVSVPADRYLGAVDVGSTGHFLSKDGTRTDS